MLRNHCKWFRFIQLLKKKTQLEIKRFSHNLSHDIQKFDFKFWWGKTTLLYSQGVNQVESAPDLGCDRISKAVALQYSVRHPIFFHNLYVGIRYLTVKYRF